MKASNLQPQASNLIPSTSNQWPPTISIIIPTLNSEKTLGACLESIAMQDYPRDKIEIIIADGGSTDQTLNIIYEFSSIHNFHLTDETQNPTLTTQHIASTHQPLIPLVHRPSSIPHPTSNIHIVPNKLKTGEAGKAAAVKYAKNDLLAFIDSDNILPSKDWLERMVEPFQDPEIIASEPIEYTYRKEDGYITRYCALLGMNDPLCLFLGNYDRNCALTERWTEMPHKSVPVYLKQREDKVSYLKIELDKKHLPTIGANGFLIRRSALLSVFTTNLQPLSVSTSTLCPPSSNNFTPDYLFDIDVIYKLLNSSTPQLSNSMHFAKVKTGIVHIFSGNIKTFARKQRRRIRDYLYYEKLGIRKYPWKSSSKIKLIKFILSCLTVIPLLIHSFKGYVKKPDEAWLFHPAACWITLWEYGLGKIGVIFGVRELKRKGWRQ